jgi:hypothetical protein
MRETAKEKEMRWWWTLSRLAIKYPSCADLLNSTGDGERGVWKWVHGVIKGKLTNIAISTFRKGGHDQRARYYVQVKVEFTRSSFELWQHERKRRQLNKQRKMSPSNEISMCNVRKGILIRLLVGTAIHLQQKIRACRYSRVRGGLSKPAGDHLYLCMSPHVNEPWWELCELSRDRQWRSRVRMRKLFLEMCIKEIQ